MRILVLLLLAGVARASSPVTTINTGPVGPMHVVTSPTMMIVPPPAASPAPLPPTCVTCDKARPLRPSKQWETDHAFAHHLVDVLLRMEGRRITADASEWRPLLAQVRAQVQGLKLANPNSAAFLLLDECCKTIETLILRVERLEGEIKRGRQ